MQLPPGAQAATAAAFLPARVDQPVDPNEPTYCTCKRVSFGDMIACESEGCPVEWFHFECVGLSPGFDPKDPWLCPTCSGAGPGGVPGGGALSLKVALKTGRSPAGGGKRKDRV